MEKRHFYDGLMYYPQQLQQCSCSFIIEFMNWYFMWFLRACVEPLHTLILVGAFLVYMHRRLCKLSVLNISKILKILGGLASQFS